MDAQICDDVEPHSISRCLFLHLAPGVANIVATLVGLSVLWNPSLSPALIYGIFTNLVALIPIQLGYLYYLAKKRGNQGWSLDGVVVLTQPLSFWKRLLWVLVILVPTGCIFLSFQPMTDFFMEIVPVNIYTKFLAAPDISVPIIVVIVNILLTALIVPITEEIYFRGFLLPRIPTQFGRGKPIAHSFLFAVYHLDSPWMIPVRTLGLLPLIYVALHKKNTQPGIIAHCLVNFSEFAEVISNRLKS